MKPDKIRIACVGDSITAGYGLPDKDTQSYPARLQNRLGPGFDVINYGVNGATLLSNTMSAYTRTEEFLNLVDSYSDIFVIELGTNDLLPGRIDLNMDRFMADYESLISIMKKGVREPRIFVTSLTPINSTIPELQDFLRNWHPKLQKMIETVARFNDIEYIDIFTPLAKAFEVHPDLIPDGVHSGPKGADIIAETMFWALYPISI